MLKPAKRQPDARLFPATDFWHVNSPSGRIPARFKEWSHFSVLAGNFDLLVNFSLVVRGKSHLEATPRLILLFSDAEGAWDGDVETFGRNETSIVAGSADATLGRNSVRFAASGYHVEAALSKRDFQVALDLVPVTRPLVADNVRLTDVDSFRWVVVPHLRARGEVRVAGRRYSVTDAPAYHDRNSGCFEWGGAFAWEWATILPPDVQQQWCLAYSRIGNRARGAMFSQSLLVWRRDALRRKYYGRDLSVSHEGLLRRERGLCLPRVAALVTAGAADVPRQILVSARGYGDQVTLRMSFNEFAQIVTPNDRWPGFTSLFEIKGHAEVAGRVGGERIEFEGRVQAELNHAVG